MSFLVDLANTAVGGASVRPTAALTADTNGAAIDLLTAEGPTHMIVVAGVTDFASTDETYTVALYESDTSGGTYTAVTDGSTTITATATDKMISTNKRTKRYVRVQLDVGGTTPSIFLTAFVFARKKIVGSGTGYQS